MNAKSYTEPVYLISQVSSMLDIHPQTLRQYEKEGLVKPSRLNGRIRLYSASNIDRIKDILNYTRKLGVNLAGVQIILKQKEEITKLQNELKNSTSYKKENNTVVPSNKALILKKSSYDMIVFED